MPSRATRVSFGPQSVGGFRVTYAKWVNLAYRFAPVLIPVLLYLIVAKTLFATAGPAGALATAVVTAGIVAAAMYASWRVRLKAMRKTGVSRKHLTLWTHLCHLVRLWRLFGFWARAVNAAALTRRGPSILPPPRPATHRDDVWGYLDHDGTIVTRVKHGSYGVTTEALFNEAGALAQFVGAYDVAVKDLRHTPPSRKGAFGELATAWAAASGISEVRFFYSDPIGQFMRLRELPMAPKEGIAFGRHVDRSCAYIQRDKSLMVFGMTGFGKSNIMWTILADLIRERVPVRLYVSDPKMGMELAVLGEQVDKGTDYFQVRRYAMTPAETTDMIASLEGAMKKRQKAMRERGERKHTPTIEDPLVILLCDEFLALSDDIKKGADSPLGRILFQGRAAGYIVIGLAQEPTKDTIGALRSLIPQRIALRLDNPASNIPALSASAPCHEIDQPGVGYYFRAGDLRPAKFRAPYVTDAEIALIAQGKVPDMPGDEVTNEPTVLYRYYGVLPVDKYPEFEGREELLYLGIAGDFDERHAQHEAEEVFMDYVTRHTIETWPSRSRALVEEAQAIREEQPIFNDQHNRSNTRRRPNVKRPFNDPRRQAQARRWHRVPKGKKKVDA